MLKEANKIRKFSAENLKIGILASRFNQSIVNGLLNGCLRALKEFRVQKRNIKIVWVPGSFELPLAAQRLAETKKFNALICLGAIIKGQTAHFEYISWGVTYGLQRVMLDFGLPISFGVLTCYNINQAKIRAKNNQTNKGYEAALAALAMANLKN